MRELRKFLAGVFVVVAVVCAIGTFSPVVRSADIALRHGISIGATLRIALQAFDIGAGFLLAFSLLNAAACWAVLANKPSQRVLGIAASALPCLTLLLIVTVAPIHDAELRLPDLIGFSVGLAAIGCIAFIPKLPAQNPACELPTKIPGDGTHPWFSKSIWVIGTVLFLYFENRWFDWADSHKLLTAGVVSFLSQIVLAELPVILLHELGHTFTGLALGMKLRAFIVGPFQWRLRESKWKFKLNLAGFLSAGGVAALVPTNPQEARWRQVCMIAAGPFASLVTGLIALQVTLNSPGHPWQQAWPFVSGVATLSLLAAVLNMMPFQSGGTYSDGAYIYQLLTGGIWADYYHALSIVLSSLVTPLRARDFDIDAIKRASLGITQGRRAMMLHIFACSYYLDQQRITEAVHSSNMAESIYNESVFNIPVGLHTDFVFRRAYLHRDAAGARQWWDRMEAKKPTQFNVDYWLAHAALHWIEGSPITALDSWEKANSIAQGLPSAGAYEFDRDRCEMLRKAINSSENATPA